MNIAFVSGNLGKTEQVKRYLQYPVVQQKLDLPEIQSLDSLEIVKQKAYAAYQILKQPVLVEDTSLTFPVLGKLPGPFIKWFLQELGADGLCRLLDQYDSRVAHAQVCFGLYDGIECQYFIGAITGIIATEPRGTNDFGWGVTFIPDGYDKTWAEMTTEEQEPTAIRKIALLKLAAYLEKLDNLNKA